MRIALAQINSQLGAFSLNMKKILNFVEKAKAQSAELIVFPEAAIFGYHPVDLLERPTVVDEQMRQLNLLHKGLPAGVAVVVGAIVPNEKKGKPYWNAAVWLEKGKKMRVFPKELLPTYDVFDEGRHIQPGRTEKNQLKWKGRNLLITICEDIWAWPHKAAQKFSRYEENPLTRIPKSKKIDLVINLSASPFAREKMVNRMQVTSKTSSYFRAPMLYVNLVGAQDELIFDGASFALDKKQNVIAQCKRFEEDLVVFDLDEKVKPSKVKVADPQETLKNALVLGLRDFFSKTGFKKAHLGLSGGVDSALVACLAVEALGAENVQLVAMPGPYSASDSLKWAKIQAANLGCKLIELSIVEPYSKMKAELDRAFGDSEFGMMHENLQARLRGLMLMSFANKENSLLLSTSNKSEMAVGFSTLYGDMCGALAPIGDLLKHQVYELCDYYNRNGEVIPKGVLTRAPSAELRPNQKDADTLPEYSVLDQTVENLVEHYSSAKSETDKWVLNALMRSEFKRWQAPPILKVSNHAFGRGRRFPIAHNAIF